MYVRKQLNGKRNYVHRQVMEKHLGRKLSYDEVVHHIDLDHKNNELSNLKIMSRSEHTALHRKLQREEVK